MIKTLLISAALFFSAAVAQAGDVYHQAKHDYFRARYGYGRTYRAPQRYVDFRYTPYGYTLPRNMPTPYYAPRYTRQPVFTPYVKPLVIINPFFKE